MPLWLVLVAACASSDGKDVATDDTDLLGDTVLGPVALDVTSAPPDSLSELDMLRWTGGEIEYAPGMLPFELATPLFSDYAVKRRALWIPEGQKAAYQADGPLDLPVGSALVKSFLFPADLREPDADLRLVETRLMLHTPSGWQAWPYVWNEDATEATLAVAGATRSVEMLDANGELLAFDYLVPQRNQCLDCHELKVDEGRVTVPIGPTARNLNHTRGGEANVLQAWADAEKLSGLPALAEVDAATDSTTWTGIDPTTLGAEALDQAARDYLDVNCAHCHNRQGAEGVSSQLFLTHDEADDFNLGVCKSPGSAGKGTGGLDFDIVPGDSEASILLYRMATTELGAMMPDLGRAVAHEEGNRLIAAWIDAMEGSCGP